MENKLSLEERYNIIPHERRFLSSLSDRENGCPVELISLSNGKEIEFTAKETLLFFNRQGSVCLSSFREKELLLTEKQLVIFLPGEKIKIVAKEDSSLLLWKANEVILFYEYIIRKQKKVDLEPLFSLKANKHIENMFELFVALIKEGFTAENYIESKLSELLILMRMFYSKEQLARFFLPLKSINHTFKKRILLNYNEARTVKELASKVNLSKSGLHQYFKKIHGMSPAKWMKEEKAKQVYLELTATTKSIKDIWLENGFSSASYFNQFCRKHFGYPPTEVRKRNV